MRKREPHSEVHTIKLGNFCHCLEYTQRDSLERGDVQSQETYYKEEEVHTKGGHDSSKDNNANWLQMVCPNWILVLILMLHCPLCEPKNGSCQQIQHWIQCRGHNWQWTTLNSSKNLSKRRLHLNHIFFWMDTPWYWKVFSSSLDQSRNTRRERKILHLYNEEEHIY